jgi:hypothetical protein
VCFVLLLLGYGTTFSFDHGDSLDTARWMQQGHVAHLLEFRHLIQRLLPFWLWLGLQQAGLALDPLRLLHLWDMITAALSVLLFYRVIQELAHWRPLSLGLAFLYATTHSVWVYAGTGRLYSTAILFILTAYYLALTLNAASERKRWLMITAAAAYTCLAGFFWLVHVFNSLGVGLLILLLPREQSWSHRARYLATYAAVGLLLAGAILVSCLSYGQVPLTAAGIQEWVAGTRTPPTKFNWQSPMNAVYGHHHGILALPHLTYMINGFLRRDSDLLAVNSLPWQMGKFLFLSLLAAVVYGWAFRLLWRGTPRQRALLVALGVPLAILWYFALTWLGTDRQRFMPVVISIYGFAAVCLADLLPRLRRPRLWGLMLVVSLGFIAAVNYAEVLRPSQKKFVTLAGDWSPLRSQLTARDLVVDFGRDMDYQPVIPYYASARFLSLTNDVTYYDWDRPDWLQVFRRIVRQTWQEGGRVFVVDRIALGRKPVEAAWSEKQHPRPTVAGMAQELRSVYCVEPAFAAGPHHYYELRELSAGCPERPGFPQ